MDFTTIIKKLDISAVKILTLRVFGKDGAVCDYLIEKANTAVNLVLEANAGTVMLVRGKMKAISEFMLKYRGLIPSAWLPYADKVQECFYLVYQATEDCRIETSEGAEIKAKITATVNDFRIAYSEYRAD